MISIEGEADQATRALIRDILEAAPGRINLFIEAGRPAARPAAVRLVEVVSAPPLQPRPPRPPQPKLRRFNALLEAVALETGLGVDAIAGENKEKRLVRARDAVVTVATELLPLSSTQIGVRLGGRDHSTVICARRRGQRRLVNDPAFRLLCDRVRSVLEEAR